MSHFRIAHFENCSLENESLRQISQLIAIRSRSLKNGSFWKINRNLKSITMKMGPKWPFLWSQIYEVTDSEGIIFEIIDFGVVLVKHFFLYKTKVLGKFLTFVKFLMELLSHSCALVVDVGDIYLQKFVPFSSIARCNVILEKFSNIFYNKNL